MSSLKLDLKIELEQDGDRWIADVVDLPGVMVYGTTKREAFWLRRWPSRSWLTASSTGRIC